MNPKSFIALRYMLGRGWLGRIVIAIAFAPPVLDVLLGIGLFFVGMTMSVVRQQRRTDFITVISGISILGIKVGVAALICVLAVFNGFNALVTDLLVGFDPHLRIQPTTAPTFDPDPILELLQQYPEITAAAPFVSGRSAVLREGGLRVIQVRGMRAEDISSAIGLRESIIHGEFAEPSAEARHPIVLGYLLSYGMHASIGDTLSLLSQAGLEESLTQLAEPALVQSTVTGVFETANKEYDNYYAYTDLQTARELFDLPEGAMGIEVRLDDLESAPQVRAALLERLPDVRIETWQDLHRDLFAVMELERWAAFVILSLIIVVAVFNVLGSLTMTVIKKRRDIGILKTMGASDAFIQRLFLRAGVLVGVIGTISGLIWGVGLALLQKEFGFFSLDSSVYIIPALPVEVRAFDLIVICSTSLLLSALAALYPARRAAALLPSDAVRWE